MLERPDISDEQLSVCLRDNFDLHVTNVSFLPLGADVDTAVFQVIADDGQRYFVKLRRDSFDGRTARVPYELSNAGVPNIIPTLATTSGRLWADFEEFAVILNPYVSGTDGFDRALDNDHWRELGRTLRAIHSSSLSGDLMNQIPRETFDPYWRQLVKTFQRRVEHESFSDPAAAQLADLMREHRETISDIVTRAEQLADGLHPRQLEMVVCHGDIHAGNVLISDEDNALVIVDWDTINIAPKERDLMYIGAGIGHGWNTEREASLFYEGYGRVEIDPTLLAFYRFDRIAQDIGEFCRQLLLTDEGGDDREQAVYYFSSQFFPGSVVEMAYKADPPR